MTQAPERKIPKGSRAKSILIIEDNADHRELINIGFQKTMPDVKLHSMNDQKSTLDFLATKWLLPHIAPELILLDLYLPRRQDGLALLDAMRSFFTTNNLVMVPIVVFSSSNNEDDVKACYRHKANAYMVKSPDINKWVTCFEDLKTFWWDTAIMPRMGSDSKSPF